ncbi:hypothetical protein [Nocardioides abyssi]|uniref:DNA-binding response regulator n=1 Tax=Nocardioides abyssi TaxID=3058370 RepID=A0ABT8ETN5_9ACTN|nr:hypothetical protein [Nocardioides abyssi]MDN4161480.1 hypothetical protein [Nocardioides abyssi]
MTPRGPGRDRTVVVGRQALLVQCWEVVLLRAGYEVQGVVRSPADPLPSRSTVLRSRPGTVLLLVDLDRELEDVVSLVSALADTGIPAVVLTRSSRGARWGQCLQHGAGTVIGSHEPMTAVLDALDLLSRGLPAVDRAERDALLELAGTWAAGDRLP